MKNVLALFAVAGVASAASAQIFLDFEGITNGPVTAIGNYYAGQGVFFTGGGSNALAIRDLDAGGTGNFANEPSASNIMFFVSGNSTIMNVPTGFTTGFATYYTTVSDPGTLFVYDGIDGTGNLLGTTTMFALGSDANGGDPNGTFNRWDIASVNIGNQVARSVVFAGAADRIGFDDMIFGGVPTPGSAAVAGIAGLAALRRRR
ncbi:MAG: PEP-CTERM sorting domain-containing protein [Planctomycetes bacterium]|nr:PEP-CTERM sorting domain-containing protein [Planctomycetota bacterium]